MAPRTSPYGRRVKALGRSGAPTTASVAWDAWCATRGGPSAVATRQHRRLGALVAHARRRSPFYAGLYRGLPGGSPVLERLPTVTKPQLMDRFDEWVTDPAVTRAAVEEFVAELDNIGVDFLGRYVVVTTSGSTGVPALLVQDRRAIAVMTGLAYVRTGGLLTPRLVTVRGNTARMRSATSAKLSGSGPVRTHTPPSSASATPVSTAAATLVASRLSMADLYALMGRQSPFCRSG